MTYSNGYWLLCSRKKRRPGLADVLMRRISWQQLVVCISPYCQSQSLRNRILQIQSEFPYFLAVVMLRKIPKLSIDA